MKGDPKVIELLNEALKAELTAINQYWLHYRILDDWGVKKLAEMERHESIDEMKHADRMSERILFLEGFPNFQALNALRIGETVEEILKADLEGEYEAVEMYRKSAAYCESVGDFVSRDLFVEGDGDRLADLDASYVLGTSFTVRLEVSDGHIRVFYNGAQRLDHPFSGDGLYFKAGVYTQSNAEQGEPPGAAGQVVITALTGHGADSGGGVAIELPQGGTARRTRVLPAAGLD